MAFQEIVAEMLCHPGRSVILRDTSRSQVTGHVYENRDECELLLLS